ncbi:GNAT family N-acetyltransferase [Marinicella gelatinilytica]|uniref:GNAT family N-acetyltransferase n=1 Tax=Marinicella gelatinilytica TaxID=2996017 RepID=UPI002260FD73|nr:GNAT family N-acetyltransferase [Marinicella gelatinilytica]MCX7545726.1 GNAT family N-acetyltransferase [Marinicella gelatinilytica]
MTNAEKITTLDVDGVTFLVKEFTALSALELKQIYQLRQQVFIIEQNCPYADIDEADLDAWHICHQDAQNLDAYARILTDKAGDFHIGRVVVSADKRKQGLGQALMKAAIKVCRDAATNRNIIISAQSYLARFYRALGFVETGDYYLEDNIPHMQMVLPAKP